MDEHFQKGLTALNEAIKDLMIASQDVENSFDDNRKKVEEAQKTSEVSKKDKNEKFDRAEKDLE